MQVKGSAIETLPLYIKKKFGDEAYGKWLSVLGTNARKEFESLILATKWYPLQEMFIEPTEAFCKMFYNGDVSGAVELGRFSAEHSLKGIYKIFVKFGSPDFIVSRAPGILPTFYSDSAMDVVDREDKKVTIRFTKFEGSHTLVEHRIRGWMEKALEISGAKNVSVTIVKSIAKGDVTTDYAIKWE